MIIIKNGKVLTMAGQSYDCACVAIDQGKIIALKEWIEPSAEDEVIDAMGMIVMPGLIDAHCHLGMFEDGIGFEGADGNEATQAITPQLRAIDGINPLDKSFREAYEAGVTTVMTGPGSVNVIGGQFAVIKTYGKRIDHMILKSPAALKISFGENPKKGHGEKGRMPVTRMGIAALLRETLTKAVDYRAKQQAAMQDGKHFDTDLGMEAIMPVLKGEIPLKAHVHRADDMFTALRIAKEFDLKITLDHVTEGHLVVDELAGENVPLIVGPSFGGRGKFEIKEKTFETPGVLSNAGFKVAIVTDHPVIPLYNLINCAAFAIRSGMDEDAALKAITITPAEIMGVSDRVGSLEVGKDADIVIFDGPVFDIMTKTQYVLIDGKIIYRRRP
ncbi:amidohydrolase [Fusibacter sp. 3D3]|uniref:amidohydrolase n=1 Tax=Fusibacter sp. 3D3 TaxID=1048380 RepID=UPI000852D4E5|nr:amidohydrolase [Fusibacter sp. 3D3]GAU78947.1 amidohydrolase [Fusibacter sp. 3D3]